MADQEQSDFYVVFTMTICRIKSIWAHVIIKSKVGGYWSNLKLTCQY